MAITQTGSTLQIGITSTANTGTVSSTITVPSDAQIVIVGLSGYAGPADAWGGAPFESMTFTKGGTDTAMTKVHGGDGNNAVEWQGAMFYLAAPDTGTNKTLKWNWYGTDTIADGTLNFSITFWKGVDAADPVRHQAGNHSGATGYAAIATTNPLIAQTGDKIVAWCGFYRAGGTGDGTGSIDTWTNLTELTEITHNSYTEGAWATGDPTGNVLVGIASGTNVTQPNLLAVTLREAGSVQRRDGDLAHITSVKAFNGFQTILKAATFTPSNNSRVVVVSTALVPYGEAATHTTNATISGGGLTWTRHKRAYYYDSSQWASAVYIWTAPVTTGASMAVTVTYSPSSPGFVGGYGLDVFEFPDSYAVIQTFEDGGDSGDVLSGSYDGDFSTAPSSSSYLIAATSINSNTLDGSAMTPGSGWTEVSENVNTFYNSETQYVTGTTDTAVTWANLDPNINYSWAIGAIEIGGAAGGGVSATFGVTVAPVTVSANADLLVQGNLAQTISAVTLVSSGDLLIKGQLAATLDPVTLAAAGSITQPAITGTLNVTIGPVTLAAYGSETGVPAGGGNVPYWGPSGGPKQPEKKKKYKAPPPRREGGHIPAKELRRAVRELLAREAEKEAETRKKPQALAKAIVAEIPAPAIAGLARKEAISFVARELRQELPQSFYSEQVIRDNEKLMRIILLILKRLVALAALAQQAAEDEEEEELIALLLSAA